MKQESVDIKSNFIPNHSSVKSKKKVIITYTKQYFTILEEEKNHPFIIYLLLGKSLSILFKKSSLPSKYHDSQPLTTLMDVSALL